MATRGMNSIVKQAQRMQQQIARVQDDMADTEVEATAGGGAVLAVVTGAQRLVRLEIDPEVVDPEDVETLKELVISAVNLAMENAKEMIQSEVNKITGGISIPGLF